MEAFAMRVPKVVRVTEARNRIKEIMEAAEHGETFLIEGPGNREAFLASAALFRHLQDSVLELIGELETQRILADEDAMQALRATANGEATERITLEEVEGMIAEDEFGER